MAVPTKDTLLIPYSGNWVSRITVAPLQYGLTADQGTQLSALQSPYADAYAEMMEARGAGTRSENLTAIKDAAKAAMLPYLRELYTFVQGNSSVADADKVLLGVTIRRAPTPVPPPDVQPGMDLIAVNGRTVSVHIHDSASLLKRGKPAGALGASIYSFVGATYPTDPSAWTFQGQSTRDRFDIQFPESVAPGSQVWVCAAWYNRKAESGPPSSPISAYLQFGLSQAA